ncbi:hypothetical protein [Aureimonas sp. AU20]|uniref:hypothetical protein n=1 Tax=Aureimonas sp. AU20 TaxID=1349819 RepID=UPI00071FCFDF|nr:hypothetical protein [Aureimonas sp. AU20]ALN73797.1 hypothetical protein M673_13810 [Aureimonas sp. AU20]
MRETKRDRRFQPTRRDVLAGGLALAGAGLVGATGAGATAPEGARGRLILTLETAGPVSAEAALAQAAPLLVREGFAIDAVDLLVADGTRPAGFAGRLLTPAALTALPPERLARLLAEPGPAQITAPWSIAPPPTGLALDRLATLLGLVPELACCVVALSGMKRLHADGQIRFEASLAPFARTLRG